MAWDDIQTASDNIDYNEWNTMVTDIKNHWGWRFYGSGSATGQSTFTISSLPSKYMWKLYVILTPNDNSWLKFRINGDSGSNYDYYQIEGTTVNDYKNQGQVHLGDSTSGMPLPLEILFNGKVGSGGKINVQLHRHDTRPSDGKSFQIMDANYHGGSSDVSSVSFNIDSGSFDIKYALYYEEDIENL